MYKRISVQILLCNMIIMVCWFSVKTLQVNRVASTPAFRLQFVQTQADNAVDAISRDSFFGMLKSASSGQRVVEYNVLEQTSMELPKEEYEVLVRIVEAEAGNQDEKGRMLVAGVVLNRVKSDKFPDTVKAVVFQAQNGTCQFSPVANGRYYSVKISDETIEAVDKVLAGEDVTEGALYFAARKYANPEKMKWFDNHLTKLFSYGGHEFFY